MSWKELRMLTKGNVGAGMKMLFVFALVLALHSPVLGYGSAKEGKCPPLPADVNCAFKLINSDSESIPCNRQDLECLGDMKCCEDGCGGYECKPAIGLPPLPVIEPHCISAEVRVGDQCEPANITYCYADRCNSCCVHNSVCNPSSEHISLEECKEKLCHGIKCPGQGEICVLDKYHRAVCRCPTECPPDTPNMPVCGSDGLTHENECEMNMTACVTGDRIRVVNQGSCRRNPREVCSLPKDKGFGWTLDLKYYFNKQKGVCEGFIYHGKGGNENNFEKYKDCVDMCFGTVSDVCVLPKLIGPCRAAFPRWHFNSLVRRCESFIYGGCAGNRNNFESEEECNNQCVCNLPKAPGICLGYFPSWFYNSRTEKCEKFIYGGCHGNANRFYSQERCQNSCGGGADDVLKPRCHGKSKFNCHSIKKCLPISKKCNGVDDCGDNSDEEGCDPCADKKCDFYSTCVTTKNNTALCDCPTICTADWNPVCGSDNETYPNLCTMQVESCQRQELITKVSDGECGGTPRTKCEIHRDEQQSKMLVGVYIPQCEEDGSYSEVQCHGSTGYCWCVDGEGNKLMETEVEPGQRLNCTGGPPPTDPPVNICDTTVCEFGSCVEVDGNATCQCNKICPLLYDPVCGTNNKTYPNPCVMDAEACEKKEVIRIQYSGECKTSPGGPPPTDPPVNICDTTVCEFGSCVEVDGNATCQCHKICPLLYDPVCGTNNKTYVNPCVMEAEACEKKDHIQKQYSGECKETIDVVKVIKDPCQDFECKYNAHCVPLTNGSRLCECPQICTREFDPVCGSDGLTYSNPCKMRVASCEKQELITKTHSGRCGVVRISGGPLSKCEKERAPRENGPLLLGAFIPQCEVDGSYSEVQCLGSTGYCWCVDSEGNKLLETEVGPGLRPNCTKETRHKTKCEKERATRENGPLLVGAFIPQCEEDGSYSEVQCYGSTGYCWCVDSEGNKRLETEVGPGLRPNCTTETRPKTKCEKEKAAKENGPLLIGAFIPQCEEDGSYSEVQCRGSTGYCWCVDSEGNKRLETEVGPGLRPNCTTEETFDVVSKIKDPCRDFECKYNALCVPLTNGSRLCECPQICTREFDPVCGSDGLTYSNPCEMRVASCEKQELITKEHNGRCGVVRISGGPLSKCEKEKFARENGPLLVGEFIPLCEEDGSYSEVQCHGSTGYCWCVDSEGNKRLETEVDPGLRPNCTTETRPKTKCEKEKAAKENGPLLVGAFIPQCEEDGSYSEVQCRGSTGYCWCVDSEGNKRLETEVGPGLRPNCTTEQTIDVVNKIKDPCQDFECKYNALCVPLTNGSRLCECPQICTREFDPVCGSDGLTYSNPCKMRVASCEKQELITKAHNGRCGVKRISGGPLSKCEKEKFARGNGPFLLGKFIPQCEEDGSYSEVQCRGSTGYCWCVDNEGNKRLETEVGPGLRPNCTTELPPTNPPLDPCDIHVCEFGVCVNENGTAKCVCHRACPLIEQPVCGSDNKTYFSLCVMDGEACERKTYIKAKHNGPCGTKSKCQKELEMAMARQQPGTFIPKCEEDGRYSSKQCHTSTGYCWCATPQGEKILETQLRFKHPDCSKNIKFDPCASVECDFYGTCVALDNGDHICDCPRFCTKEYAPVCASNGKTYGSICEMKVASCATQQMLFVESNGDCGSPTTTAPSFNPCDISLCDFGLCVNENGTAKCVCNQACPFIEQPVCGSDNKTYANLCVMDAEACERKQRITVQNDGPCEEAVPSTGNNPCALIDCPFYSECELSNGIAECVCALGCTRELNPKCGSDNITYDNPCELRRASCEAKKEITIVKDGECIVPTTALPTVAIARPAKCKNCPKFGEENVVSSFCKWYNKFAIIGEFLNMSKNGREITVKVETKYKPIAENTKFIPKSTVRIKVQKVSNCQCDNLEFKKNERYVFMGKKTTKRTFVIKWKTGFVEKVSKPLVKKLNKSLQRLKTWGFCVQRSSG